jgi:hypothetical protein
LKKAEELPALLVVGGVGTMKALDLLSISTVEMTEMETAEARSSTVLVIPELM